jgi:signal transduction histidine kinase
MQNSEIILLVALVTTLIILLLAIFITYASYQYTNLKTSFDKEVLTAQLEIQEQTLFTISREIHDNINGYLILAKLNLNTTIPLLSSSTKCKVEDTVRLLDHSLEEIRSFSRMLNPEYVAFQGLSGMLKEYTDWIKKNQHYQVSFSVEGEQYDMEDNIELMLFRILQETINNILKHAQATTISLLLTYTDSYLKCTISDNGIGFDVEEKLHQKYKFRCSGLRNILRRAKMINAVCDITSTHKNGTTICITTAYNQRVTKV